MNKTRVILNKTPKRSGASPTRYSFDAVTEQGKRRTPRQPAMSPDRDLRPYRDKMDAITHDSANNIVSIPWAIRQRNAYLTDQLLDIELDDEAKADKVLAFWKWWKRPENCHVAERHDFDSLFSLHESACIIYGDAAIILAEGRVQIINGRRILSQGAEIPADIQKQIASGELIDTGDGIIINKYGVNRYYLIKTTSAKNKIKWDCVPADCVIFDGYYQDGDEQVRGVTPLAPAIKVFMDMYQINDFMMAKLRLQAMLGIFFTKDAEKSPYVGTWGAPEPEPVPLPDPVDTSNMTPEELADYTLQREQAIADAEASERSLASQLTLGSTPSIWTMQGQPGDGVDLVESKNPSNEYQTFISNQRLDALLCLDLPYSFSNSSGYGYPSIKIDTNNAVRAMEPRMNAKRLLLNRIFEYALRYYADQLGFDESDVIEIVNATNWVGQNDMFLDELQQVKAAKERIDGNLSDYNTESLRITRIPYRQVIQKKSKQIAFAMAKNVPIPFGKPGQSEVVGMPSDGEFTDTKPTDSQETKR